MNFSNFAVDIQIKNKSIHIQSMYFTLFITVIITAVFLVVAAYITAKLLGPRTYNRTKGEPF